MGTFVFLYLNSREKEILYADVHPTGTTIERSTVLTGKIEPRDEIQIKPQISGIISEICVEAGEFVKEGDIIAKNQGHSRSVATFVGSEPRKLCDNRPQRRTGKIRPRKSAI